MTPPEFERFKKLLLSLAGCLVAITFFALLTLHPIPDPPPGLVHTTTFLTAILLMMGILWSLVD